MARNVSGLKVICCALSAFAAAAYAQTGPTPIPGPETEVYPSTREYVWTFHVPVVTNDRYEIVVPGPRVVVRSRRYDYETPGLKYERRKLGEMPEFYCKYPDWWVLPNECGVMWHNVYADFPQLTMRREHIDVDVPEWSAGEHTIRIDVPRVVWTERTLRIEAPVLTTQPEPPHEWSRASGTMLADASVDQARATLERGRVDSMKAIDEALAKIDAGIAAVEAQGADPAKIAGADGKPVDLRAARAALLDERTKQAARYAQIRGQLDAATRAPGS